MLINVCLNIDSPKVRSILGEIKFRMREMVTGNCWFAGKYGTVGEKDVFHR